MESSFDRMIQRKFDCMIREFPFLAKIFAGEHLSANSIRSIKVRRADQNLLEVRPGGRNFDAGSFSEGGYRNFWIVSPGEIIRLKDAFYKDEAYIGRGYTQEAGLIANQLVDFLDRQISHIVEVNACGWDWEEWGPKVIIYKMHDLAWRRFVRPI